MTDSPSVVFLLGVPRSGTTLLSWLLNQHQSLYAPPEPWLLLGLDALGQTAPDHVADPPLLSGAVAGFLGDQRLQKLKQAALAIYKQALEGTGKSIFVDKTPRYYHVLNFIQEFLPESKIVFLVRNPLDVAASFKTAWSENLPKIISSQEDTPFLFDYILGLNYFLVFEKNHPVLRVYYEDLVADSESQMSRIFDYLSLSAQALNKDLAVQDTLYARSSFGDVNSFATHHIHTRSIDSYKNVFAAKEIEILVNALGKETFSQLGYMGHYHSACEEFNITPSDKLSPQLLEVAENYVRQRKKHCANPESRGILEQHIEHLKQQAEYSRQQAEHLRQELETAQDCASALDEQLDSAQRQNTTLEEELALTQKQNEALSQQIHFLQNMGLRARAQADLRYIKTWLKHAIYMGLWRIAQGPPPPPLPKITLVTPVLNGTQYIEATLRSVLEQRYPALEFIIVDGGSNDGTLEIIDRIQNDPTFKGKIARVISEPDQGMYDAIAKGFSQATGEILAYLNCDDLLECGALLSVGEYFARHPKTAVIYHEDTVLVDNWKFPNVRQPKGISTADLLCSHILFQDGVFFRRSAYQAMGGLRRDFKLAGDYDLWLRLSAKYTFVRRPCHVSCFRVRQGQISEDMERYFQEMNRSRTDFIAKASRFQMLHWKIQIRLRFLRKFIDKFAAKNRLFFPADFANLPPPQATLSGTEYSQAVSPIDGKPTERILFSAPDTRFGDNIISHIYLDTRHAIAITYPPVKASELDKLYRQHYSAPPLVVKNAEGTSPYRLFNGKTWWERVLLCLPVENYKHNESNDWITSSLYELTSVLVASRVDVNRTLRVLDVGCFEGNLLDEVAVQKPWQVYGIEPNIQAVERARSKGHSIWQGHAEDAPDIIPASYQFEVIFMGQSIEHVDNPVRVLRRLRLLLAPGGVLVVSTPNLDSRQIDWFGPTWAHWHTPYHRYIFSRKGLFALARQVGLQPVCFKTFSDFYWSALSIIQNYLGLGGSVSHAVKLDRHSYLRAQRVNFWQQLLWNRVGKGDYCFLVMRDGADD